MSDILWFIVILAFFIGLPYAYSKKGIRYCMGIAYVLGVIISIKLFYENQGVDSVLAGLVFSAQFFTFGVNPKELVEVIYTLGNKLSIPYIVCLWTAFLVCPILSVSVLLSYIKKGLDRTTLRTRFFKEVYIFTEKNENSLALCKDILSKNKKAITIFSNADATDIGVKTLCVSYSPRQIVKLLNRTNKINICFNDTESGILLDKLNDFLSTSKKKDAKVYAFTTNYLASEVIDGMKKENKDIHIEIINTNAILMREIFWDYPLYINAKKCEELNVTVLGVGDFGGYFAMNTLWCGIIPDCEFKLNLVDSDKPGNIIRRVSDNLPKGYFDIEVFNENVNTNDFFETIESTRLKESDYILVAMGNDDLNISIARKVKLYFARNGKNPFVMTVVKNQSKYHIMKETLKKDDIVVMGGTDIIYSYNMIFNDPFFNSAFEVFRIVEEEYGNIVEKEDFFHQKQIDILSSYANAIHSKYKIYALSGSEKTKKEELMQKLDENLEKIVEAEHKRWVAYEILKGYIGVKEEELPAFLENNKSTGKIHKNDTLKIHACITDMDGIKKLDDLIYKKFGKQPNLEKIDRLIAKNTVKIWDIK